MSFPITIATRESRLALWQAEHVQALLRARGHAVTQLPCTLDLGNVRRKLEVLAPDQVGALMSGFLQQVESGMPSLRLAEGELRLKLGLASSGQTQGFVILQPDARVDAQTTVHEVALKFDRSGALNLPVAK